MTGAKDDVVSEIQSQITHVTAGFFNFVGALQRDAPPTIINDDDDLMQPPTEAYDLQGQVEQMGRELREGIESLKTSIEKLPDLPAAEQGEAEKAVTAQQRDSAAAAALKEELLSAETKLEHMQHAHGIVADLALKNPPSASLPLNT